MATLPPAAGGFDPALWLATFASIGCGYALKSSRRLAFMVEHCDGEDLAQVMGQLVGQPERQEALERRHRASPVRGGAVMATQLSPRIHIARVMSGARRREIETEIAKCLQRAELLIDRLDRQDAQYEDMEDDDPAGGAADDVGEVGSDDGTSIMATRPLYAVDQTRGPVNWAAAHRAWQRKQDSS